MDICPILKYEMTPLAASCHLWQSHGLTSMVIFQREYFRATFNLRKLFKGSKIITGIVQTMEYSFQYTLENCKHGNNIFQATGFYNEYWPCDLTRLFLFSQRNPCFQDLSIFINL